MKLARLFETIGDAKQLALHLQQLALDYNLEYELEYHPDAYANSVGKVQAIELVLPKKQVKRIFAAVEKEGFNPKQFTSSDTDIILAVSIMINEHKVISVYDFADKHIADYGPEDLQLLADEHFESYKQFT